MSTPVNINELVTFRMTAAGVAVYRAWCQDLGTSETTDEGQALSEEVECRMPLWNVMQVFGAKLYNGGPVLFQGNALTFVGATAAVPAHPATLARTKPHRDDAALAMKGSSQTQANSRSLSP